MKDWRPSDEDYYRLFKLNPEGEKILDYLIFRFHDCEIFDETDPNPYKTAFAAGRREPIREILRALARAESGEKDSTTTIATEENNNDS